MAQTNVEGPELTTITVERNVHEKLSSAKPFESMSFNELLDQMIDQYDPEVSLDN